MKIVAKYFDFKVNEDINFCLFGIPRPQRDENGTFILNIEDTQKDFRCTMLSLDDIKNLKIREEYRQEILEDYTENVYSSPDAFGNTWVIVPCISQQATKMYVLRAT